MKKAEQKGIKMKKISSTTFFISLLLSLFFIGCGGSSSDGGSGEEQTGPIRFSSLDQIDRLDNGFYYEGWAIINGEAISTGKFNVTDNGGFFSVTEAQEADYSNTFAVILTIEPAGDDDLIPSDTKYIAGEVGTDGTALLNTSHPAVIGDSFESASGSFIVATPTDGEGNNEFSGAWFLDTNGPSASLNLPTLPVGWEYEGWAVVDGVPLSTGRFLNASGADDFSGFSGSLPAPPFPGEDFLVNAPDGLTFPLDLRGGDIVISVEPSPDDSPAPFTLKPLVGAVPAEVTIGANNALGNNANSPQLLAEIVG